MPAYSKNDSVPSFAADIRPLFRDIDVAAMKRQAGFDLRNYSDVVERAEEILEHLHVDMPCDSLWPQSDIDKFARWRNGGMPA
jgi:hypothetical protein